ncbi:EAL domain-containing protein [Candidatus Berkiella aquae]|uniref:Cyclic di-GMP phosphodiesterase Gmr n=1 Tax=Candidatus Berkiella aquae TaxID=295108 RepID=A0A0Q9YK18_9GAMM|nr:EAL domain-containing protein [Candidatus Berkiella aquae]MCS5710017.1 EAL domain-containing protein [Candidatus Berkiella aquae]
MNELTIATILIIGDPKREGLPVSQASSVHGFQVQVISTKSLKDAIKIILEKSIDLILCEFHLVDGAATDLLNALSHLTVRMLPIIIVAEEADEKYAIQSFRKGAKDFVIKDKSNHYLQRLPLVIEKVLRDECRYRDNTRIKKNNEAILASISDGIIGINLQGTITFANPVAAMYLKQSLQDLINHPIENFAENVSDEFLVSLKKAIETVEKTNDLTAIGQYILSFNESSSKNEIKVYLTPIFDELMHIEGYVLSFRDITGTHKSQEEMMANDEQDHLTGLLTRKSLLNQLKYSVAYCQRYRTKCAVLFIDLDGFKTFNDALGHDCGDELLFKVSERIRSVIRKVDYMARTGSDEFIVLLTHIKHTNDASKVAVKINRALLPFFELNGEKYQITASIGIALNPDDSEDPEKLLQYADFAMSLAKKKGRNHYQYFQSDLNLEAERLMRLSNDLRTAVQTEQFDLYFQPQIDAKTGELTGFEALSRWHHPILGDIPPTVFISLAEDIGIISDIGRWVFKKACEYYLIWEGQGLSHFLFSVNLSIKDLQQGDFVAELAEMIYEQKVNPNRFQLEITESIFAHNTQEIIDKLYQLKQLGFKIAMDDFGTGYSCLSYLRDLPIDVIKIDQSFVQAISLQNNERHKAILAAIFELAKCLNIATLAEGVETNEQAEYLRSLACDQFQGFLIAKPMPFVDATQFLKNHHIANQSFNRG